MWFARRHTRGRACCQGTAVLHSTLTIYARSDRPDNGGLKVAAEKTTVFYVALGRQVFLFIFFVAFGNKLRAGHLVRPP